MGDYIETEMENSKNKEIIDPEIRIFQNALDFSDLRSRETMVPRTEIIALDFSSKNFLLLQSNFQYPLELL